jgi:hypothetical protein
MAMLLKNRAYGNEWRNQITNEILRHPFVFSMTFERPDIVSTSRDFHFVSDTLVWVVINYEEPHEQQIMLFNQEPDLTWELAAFCDPDFCPDLLDEALQVLGRGLRPLDTVEQNPRPWQPWQPTNGITIDMQPFFPITIGFTPENMTMTRPIFPLSFDVWQAFIINESGEILDINDPSLCEASRISTLSRIQTEANRRNITAENWYWVQPGTPEAEMLIFIFVTSGPNKNNE